VVWSTYASFLAFAVVLVLMPGPDFAVVTRNTLASGRARGSWCAVGVASSNAVQGAAAAAGLGVLIVRVEPLFQVIKWAGIAYLLYLGVQAFRSAARGCYADAFGPGAVRRGHAVRGWRQGFLSNITNPKVLVFYLAVLPQFLGAHAPVWALLLFALSHAVLSATYLLLLVTALARVRTLLTRRSVRRALDAVTGTALVGFGARLAAEQPSADVRARQRRLGSGAWRPRGGRGCSVLRRGRRESA
jgi:threonine/homoserine/homoserine lactone efflux protein